MSRELEDFEARILYGISRRNDGEYAYVQVTAGELVALFKELRQMRVDIDQLIQDRSIPNEEGS